MAPAPKTPKLHEFAVILERDGKDTPWGIRLVGGCDFDVPLIITKVQRTLNVYYIKLIFVFYF